jgi:hypothetical protein
MTRYFASTAAILAAGIALAATTAHAETRDHRGEPRKYEAPSSACPNGRCAPGTVIRDHRGGKTVVRVCGSTGYNTNYCKPHSH